MTRKPGCLLPLGVLAIALICIVAAIAVVLLSPPVTSPIVLINSPRNAARVSVAQDTVIQAVARDDAERKIKRVELWVNDKLLDAQNSNVPGGISPFPLTMNWRPTISGTHTIIVRAFNAQGARSHATINAQAIAITDRDNDGVADATDACPDQPGSPDARGCPDRDGDGIRDADDACPDQTGASAARGCPASSAHDRDGDGLLDRADACPDQPGSPRAQGCLDADGDGVRDSADACPREPGSEQNGCPTPGDADGDGVADASDACPRAPGRAEFAGCSDDDGDGVPAQTDACPRERGSAQLAGCPDRDNDGVRDALDLCPAAPGPASNSGCPVTSASDSDNDGVRDDVDLAPTEAGSAEYGGSPPPGRGADRNGNQIPDDAEPPRSEVRVFGGLTIPSLNLDLSGILPTPRRVVEKVMVPIEIQAVSFRALQSGDLTDISCFVVLGYTLFNEAGTPVHHETPIPAAGRLNLDPGSAERTWNLPEILGEQAQRHFAADDNYSINIQVECLGIVSIHGETPRQYDLGRINVNHASPDWDGHVMRANSTGGVGGRWFHVEYRLCQGMCGVVAYQAPVLRVSDEGPRAALRWTFAGDPSQIRGFGVYVNGSIRHRTPADVNAYDITSQASPPCGETYSYHITAFGGQAGAARESPPSNTVTWTGAACPRTVRVTFETLRTGNLGGDEREYSTVGPITGVFWASVISRPELHFHMSVCNDLSRCSHSEIRHGFRLSHNVTYQIQGLFDWVHTEQASCLGNGCASNDYRAPEINYVTVMLGGDDHLSFGGTVQDVDWGSGDGSEWDTLFDAHDQVRASELVPGVPVIRTLSNREIQVSVRIEMLPE
ncbi:MAG: thrombospondin type 3 repeat-containing protein [Chloroflexi bacterium]|nr:thrombospondin type 3 repeat-containing protein [Chloroflexota bacterium]